MLDMMHELVDRFLETRPSQNKEDAVMDFVDFKFYMPDVVLPLLKDETEKARWHSFVPDDRNFDITFAEDDRIGGMSETEFTLHNDEGLDTLYQLWEDFCKEENILPDCIRAVEYAGEETCD